MLKKCVWAVWGSVLFSPVPALAEASGWTWEALRSTHQKILQLEVRLEQDQQARHQQEAEWSKRLAAKTAELQKPVADFVRQAGETAEQFADRRLKALAQIDVSLEAWKSAEKAKLVPHDPSVQSRLEAERDQLVKQITGLWQLEDRFSVGEWNSSRFTVPVTWKWAGLPEAFSFRFPLSLWGGGNYEAERQRFFSRLPGLRLRSEIDVALTSQKTWVISLVRCTLVGEDAQWELFAGFAPLFEAGGPDLKGGKNLLALARAGQAEDQAELTRLGNPSPPPPLFTVLGTALGLAGSVLLLTAIPDQADTPEQKEARAQLKISLAVSVLTGVAGGGLLLDGQINEGWKKSNQPKFDRQKELQDQTFDRLRMYQILLSE